MMTRGERPDRTRARHDHPGGRLRSPAGAVVRSSPLSSRIRSSPLATIRPSRTAPGPSAIVSPALNQRILDGQARLTFEARGGYLRSVLDALDVPVESQVATFARNSFQAELIGLDNPRTLYFSDSVAVGWVRGADLLEVAAQDPRQGAHLLHDRAEAGRSAAVHAKRSMPGLSPVLGHARRARLLPDEHAHRARRQEYVRDPASPAITVRISTRDGEAGT